MEDKRMSGLGARPMALVVQADGRVRCPHCEAIGGHVEEVETVLLWNPGTVIVEGGRIVGLTQMSDSNPDGGSEHQGYQCGSCKNLVLLPDGIEVFYP